MIEQLRLKQAYEALQEFDPPKPESEAEAASPMRHTNPVQRLIDALRWILNGAHHSRG